MHEYALRGHDLEEADWRDGDTRAFVAERIAEDVSATAINRSLEVVPTILNQAARAYRDDDGRPLLETMPPLITMLPNRTGPLPDHLGGAGPALSKFARAACSDGALRRQHRATRKQCLQTGMGVGGQSG